MKTYKITYSNYNFNNSVLGVKAENEKEALEKAENYVHPHRFAEAKAQEINEEEFLKFEDTHLYDENIRF